MKVSETVDDSTNDASRPTLLEELKQKMTDSRNFQNAADLESQEKRALHNIGSNDRFPRTVHNNF